MHHQQHRPPGRESPYRRHDLRLGGSVERRRRLVEEQHRPIREERAGQREPLTLPGGQPGPVLAEHGVDSQRQRVDELQCPRVPQCPSHGGLVGVGPGQPHVLGDRPGEQLRPLRHPRDTRPPLLQVELCEIGSPIRTRPSAGRTNPSSTFSSVDLPAPLGPTNATVSPGATSKDTSATASSERPGYVTVTRSKASAPSGTAATPALGTGVSSTEKISSAAARPSAAA